MTSLDRNSDNERIYFPGLDGIRTLAVAIVIIHHIDQYMNLFGLPQLGYSSNGMANLGVVLFFVLSGYLITYLLLAEKSKYGRIDIVKFYLRRILRIWPLYYWILTISVLLVVLNVTLSNQATVKTFSLYALLLSNLAFSLDLSLVTIAPLWSVAVEEQFYLFWPVVLNRSEKILLSLVLILIFYLSVKLFFRLYDMGFLYSLISMSAFDAMAIGGIGAYAVFVNASILKLVYSPILQLLSWILFFWSSFYKPVHFLSFIDKELYSFFFAIMIINVSTNNNSVVKLRCKLFNFLGQISYGLYVYHMVIISILSYFFKDILLDIDSYFLKYIIVYFSVISLTVLVSFLSHRYFEKKFLVYKTKFSKVLSYK